MIYFIAFAITQVVFWGMLVSAVRTQLRKQGDIK